MKFFLVSPNERSFLWGAGDRVPLGALYISSALSANKIDNEVFDLNHYNLNALLVKIKKEKPDYVGLSIISSASFKQMKELSEKVKELNQNTKIIVGGPHVSALPKSLEGLAYASIVGYGERGILKVIDGEKGIVKEDIDVNEFPIPNRSKLDPTNYSMYINNLRTASIVTSRGCPYNCAFCAKHDRKVRFRNPENIKEEVRELKKQGYNAVYILDENFVIKEYHFEEVTQIMDKEGMKYKIEMRTNDVTEERVKRLKQTGCIETALGIESGDNQILKNIKKRTTVEINRRAIEIFKNQEIPVKGFFIIGLPGETYETARKTIEFAEEMRNKGLTNADFYSLSPFPGSEIWKNPEKYNIKILSKNFDNYLQKGNPVIETEYLPIKKIEELLKEARTRWKK